MTFILIYHAHLSLAAVGLPVPAHDGVPRPARQPLLQCLGQDMKRPHNLPLSRGVVFLPRWVQFEDVEVAAVVGAGGGVEHAAVVHRPENVPHSGGVQVHCQLDKKNLQ